MMGLLPSGSANKDVTLVSIETKDFSLIIKGKPFHPRYEGLKQYRSMDFHDIMRFHVVGETEQIKIFDVDREELVDYSEQRPIFFENTIYQVMVTPKREVDLSFYHEHPLLRQAVDKVDLANGSYCLLGTLHFQNEVGLSTFEIRGHNRTLLQVTMEIYPTKLDYKRDYVKLLEEVNDEIYNLAYHFIKKTFLGAKIKLEGNPSAAEFYRLISVHFESFLKAVDRIERQPHHKLEKVYEIGRGDQLKRLDSRSRNYLRQKANVFVEVPNGIKIDGKPVMPYKGLMLKKEVTYDTFENRYVKWMINRLIIKFDDLLEKVTTKNRYEVEPDEDLVAKIEKMKKALKLKSKNSFWSKIGRLDRVVMSLVLQMAPGYRDAFQLFLTVSKGLVLQGSLYQMSVKDIATLYEYWTYIKLGQILSRRYEQISQDIVKVNRDGLFVNLDTNQSAKRVFRHPVTNEIIELMYQKTGGALPTTAQKPDTMLSIQKKGKSYTFNYVFDAKYRIDFAVEGSYYANRYGSPGPMEDDINTMHRYRDSLVVENNGPYERNAYGAYVLFPWNNEEIYETHPLYQSIDKVNIGGLPFLPKATDLVERFVENLIDKGPEEIIKEGILPRGTLEEWRSTREERVLVINVSNIEEFPHIFQTNTLSLKENPLKGWQDAKYVALYVNREISDAELGFPNGIKYYATIEHLFQEDNYLKVQVGVWNSLNKLIRPIDYGISKFVMTNLRLLQNADELPEIFVKSEEELILWKMLRRLSDRIKVYLNEKNLDDASRVQSFEIKGIEILLSRSNVVVKTNDEEVMEFSFEYLLKKPSSVFNNIVGLLQ